MLAFGVKNRLISLFHPAAAVGFPASIVFGERIQRIQEILELGLSEGIIGVVRLLCCGRGLEAACVAQEIRGSEGRGARSIQIGVVLIWRVIHAQALVDGWSRDVGEALGMAIHRKPRAIDDRCGISATRDRYGAFDE